jgi:hypothetical protein
MYMHMRKINNLQRDQAGFASIVIALILIIVLALLTVGFAELARREQQNALDKQLASQAYYAAESGVNDITQAVQQAIKIPGGTLTTPTLNSLTSITNTPPGLLDPNQCLELQKPPTGANTELTKLPSNKIDLAHGVSYSCTLLNLTPPSLVKSPVSAHTAWTTTFSTTGTAGLYSLQVNWTSLAGKSASGRPVGVFTPVSGWNAAAVLQVSITPLDDLSRQGLISNTFTAYLYPKCTGTGATYTPSQAIIVGANSCSSGTYSTTINGLNGTPNESYAINILDYYDDSSISVTNAQAVGGGGQLDFSNSQALIDVTGQAKNVLKRIQVHAPLKQPSPIPTETVEAQNICKRFNTAPIVPLTNPNGTVFDGLDLSCTLVP